MTVRLCYVHTHIQSHTHIYIYIHTIWSYLMICIVDLTRPHLLVRCHSQQTVLQHLQVRKACRECWCRQMCKLYISPLPYPRVVWYILLRIKRYICYCSAYHVSFCSVRFGARSSPQDMVFANVEISKWPLSRSKNLPSGTKPLTRSLVKRSHKKAQTQTTTCQHLKFNQSHLYCAHKLKSVRKVRKKCVKCE